MDFIVFIWLMIFAHFIGDYVLQSEYLSITKGKEWYNMLVHCILYTGSVGCVLMKWISGFPYLGIIILFVTHWFIDTWKCKELEKNKPLSKSTEKAYLYMDQLSHFIVLTALITWYK